MTQAEQYSGTPDEALPPELDGHVQNLVGADSSRALYDSAWAIADWIADNPGLSGNALASILMRFPTDEQGEPVISVSPDPIDLGLTPVIAVTEIIAPKILKHVVTDPKMTSDFLAALDEMTSGEQPSWLEQYSTVIAGPLLSSITPGNLESTYKILNQLVPRASPFLLDDFLRGNSLTLESLSRRPDLDRLSHLLGQIGLHALGAEAQALAPPPPGPFAATYYNTFQPDVSLSKRYYELNKEVADLRDLHEWEAARKVAVKNTTWAFREPNMYELCEHVCPQLVEERESPLRIVQVGCSYGYETLSLELLLSKQGIDHTIRGLDIDNEAIEGARENMLSSLDEEIWTAFQGGRYMELFEKRTEELFLPKAMAERMQFALHDVLVEPLPEDSADVIIVNNMLPYYTDAARSQILSNMLAGLRDGGVFAFEGGKTNAWCHVSGYRAWADSLSRFGLKPFSDDDKRHHNILRYTRWR